MTENNPALSTESLPDWALVMRDRMPDRGPRYTETPTDPYAADAPFIAEPWNAATASLFIIIVMLWAWRLRGRYQHYPFLVGCMPILLAGGIGGTLYHATRVSVVYFLLDVIPIFLLGVAGGVYMALQAWGRAGWWYLLGGLAGYLGFSLLFMFVISPLPIVRQLTNDPNAFRVNVTYAALAVVILTPLVWSLVKTRFRYAGWVVAAVICFVIAWFFRLVDSRSGTYLPMGTHWLWHILGAITTTFIIEYFYLVEGDSRRTENLLTPTSPPAESTPLLQQPTPPLDGGS